MLASLTRTEDLTRTGRCVVHGGSFTPNGHYDRERLVSVGICPDCDFWMDKWRMRDNPEVARINGNHYMIGKTVANPLQPKGMGGIRIHFNDGRVVTTDSLWHQGEIPERFRTCLPDNAVFAELITGRKD